MAIIKKSELKNMKEEQVNSKMIELKKELVKINAQLAIGTMPENPGRVREIKRTIAKLNTVLRSRKNSKEVETKKK